MVTFFFLSHTENFLFFNDLKYFNIFLYILQVQVFPGGFS